MDNYGRMREAIKRLTPAALRVAYRNLRAALEDRRNANRSPREVFSEIYRQGQWGRSGEFSSGAGSADDALVAPYVATIGPLLRGTVVDLGCGDFSVGKRLLPFCSRYVGVDVVPELISHLRATAREPKASFLCLDAIEDELPDGDVCLIRQVFQHLSNAQIGQVLAKLHKYATVVVTEHQPVETGTPNLDKVHGAAIRLHRNSGVYLDKPPFNLSARTLLEVPSSVGGYAGIIRTQLVAR
jgi:hypothetical protein